MATTSLWHINGRLSDLINYVENPDKTTVRGDLVELRNVFDYVSDSEKTNSKEYITAINCVKGIALQQMILTKKQFGKTDGYIAWHGYQSFKPGEISMEECHEIGVATARQMWGDRFQIIMTTHVDKDHLHNHFCFNSVSLLDGKKYNYSKKEQKRLRDTSDKICREYGLSIISKPKTKTPRNIYMDEKSGKPTRYNIYREDITEALENTRNVNSFVRYLRQKGYDVNLSGKHWKIKLPHYKNYTRFSTLNEAWTPDGLRGLLQYKGRSNVTTTPASPQLYIPDKYRNAWQPRKKTTGILALYYYYCYQLGVLPKGTKYKPTSPLLREDIRKLDKITDEIRYMAGNNIDTIQDLLVKKEIVNAKLEVLIDERNNLKNKIRRATLAEKEKLRLAKIELTAKITGFRWDLKMLKSIEKQSRQMDERISLVYKNNDTLNVEKSKSIQGCER